MELRGGFARAFVMVQAVARVHADACYTANAPIKVIGLDLERASERARERERVREREGE